MLPSGRMEHTAAPSVVACQIYGCTMLCGFAMAVGLLRVIGELDYHLHSARDAVGLVAVSVCLGIVLGLWLPRRIIRARLAHRSDTSVRTPATRHGTAATESAPPAFGFELAASLTGVLALALGALWALEIGLVEATESCRSLLTQRLMLPPGVTVTVLTMPACLGAVLLGAVATTTFVALHGWRRLARGLPSAWLGIWVAAVLAVALGAGFAAIGLHTHVRDVVTLLAVFAAGMLAVWRKPTGGAPTKSNADRATDVHALPPALLMAGVASLAIGVAFAASVPGEAALTHDAAVSMVVWALAVLVGAFISRVVLWATPSAAYAIALLLLVTAVMWVLPYPTLAFCGGAENLCRLALVACAATGCGILASDRASRSLGGEQRAIAWVGVIVAIGYAAGFGFGPVWLRVHGTHHVAVVLTLVMTAIAGLVLVFARSAPRTLRVGGLALVGVWLTIVLAGTGKPGATVANAGNDRSQRAGITRQVGRSLLETPGLRTVHAHASCGANGGLTAWNVDLTGPCWDVVVIDVAADRDGTTRATSEHWARIVRRCTDALLPGGRLVVELPADGLAREALRQSSTSPREGLASYLLRVDAGPDQYAALILGTDIPAWLDQSTPASKVTFQLYRVRDLDDVRQSMLAPRVAP